MIRAVVAWPVDAFRIPDDTSTSTSTATRDVNCKYRRSPMRSLRTCEWSAGTAARARPDRRSARAGAVSYTRCARDDAREQL